MEASSTLHRYQHLVKQQHACAAVLHLLFCSCVSLNRAYDAVQPFLLPSYMANPMAAGPQAWWAHRARCPPQPLDKAIAMHTATGPILRLHCTHDLHIKTIINTLLRCVACRCRARGHRRSSGERHHGTAAAAADAGASRAALGNSSMGGPPSGAADSK